MIFPRWLAAFMLLLGGLQGADSRLLEYYFRQLETNPAQTATQDRLLDLLKKSGDESAFLKTRPSGESTEVVLGYLHLRQKQYPEARAAFEHAAKKRTTIWPWRGLADLATAEGQPKKAAKALEKALEKQSSAELLGLIAEQWFNAGRPDQARIYWEKALTADPKNHDLRQLLARRLTDAGDNESAQKQWQMLADTAPAAERIEALREIARLQEKRSQYTEAAQTLEQAAAELSPTHWQRGSLDQEILRLFQLAGTIDLLETRWKADFETHPNQPLAALRLANLFVERGNFTAQRDTLRRSHLANPESLDLLRALAEAESASGDPDQALAYFETLIRRQPGKTEPRYRQAELLIRLGRTSEAEAQLESLRQTYVKDPAKLAELRTFLELHRLANPLIALLRQLAAADPNEIPALIEQQLRWERPPENVNLEALTLSPARRVELAQDLSERFQRYQQTALAIEWARRASRLEPENAQLAIRIADLLPRAEAADWLEQWIAERGQTLPPENVDQRLYQLTLAPAKEPGEVPSVQRSLDLLIALPVSSIESRLPSAPLQRMITANQAQPSPEAALRLTRWHRWRNDLPAASTALQLALQTFPKSTELRQELARVAADLGDFPGAIRTIEQLRQDDPKNAAKYDRQIAFFELDRDEINSALVIFQKLANENPDSVEAWQDLATAQGRGDYWFDSLTSWTKAASLASPTERYEMRTPILSITQRLSLHERARTYLLSLADETRDPIQKKALHEELAAYAQRTQGKAVVAVENSTAPPPLPNPEASPVAAQIRAYSRESTHLDTWIELASASSDETALDVWNEITRRFPRDPQALHLAADYFLKHQQAQMAAPLLSRELELGGATAAKHLVAGKLHLSLGDRLKALDHFEKAWRLTSEPLEPGTQFPLRSFSQDSRPAVAAPSPDLPANLRLEIIQEISQLARGGAAKVAWLPRWQALKDPAEKTAGLMAIGESAAALDELTGVLTADPKNLAAAKSFFNLCVEQSDFDRAFTQLQARPEHFADWLEVFLLTLNQKLQAVPTADLTPWIQRARIPSLTAKALRWPLANLFATNQRYAEATTVGLLALESQTVPDESEAALKIASWYLSLGEFDSARQMLTRTQTDAADQFTHPALIAARLEWLLAQPEERRQLLETARRESALPLAPPHAVARYALFAALGHARSEIPQAMDYLIRAQRWGVAREDSDQIFSNFIRSSAAALVQWGLPEAAAELLARAVDSDPVLLLLRGQLEAPQREEFRLRLMGTRLLAHPPARRMELLQKVLAENSFSLENLMQFGFFFEQAGSLASAYRCYDVATRQFGLNDALLSARLRTARNGVDSQAWIETFQLASQLKPPARPEITLATASQLALIADAEGRPAAAEKILLKAIQDFPSNEIILRQTAEHYLKHQNPRAAQTLLAASRIPISAPLTALQMQAALALNEESVAISLFKTHPAFAAQLFPRLLAHYSSKNRIKELASEIQSSLKNPTNPFGLRAADYVLRKQLAQQSGQVNELIGELQTEWLDRKYFAGEILIQLLIEEKRIAELNEVLRPFIQLPTVSETALVQLARLLETTANWDQSAQVYAHLQSRYPSSADYRIGLAQALRKSGKNEEAAQSLAELHQAREVIPSGGMALAHYYLASGQPESARPYFTEMTTHSNAAEQSAAYLGLTQCALALGDFTEAETQLREAAALDLSPQIAQLAAELVKREPPEKVPSRFKKLGLTPALERSARAQLNQILQNAPLPSAP